jgi:hypothetical protein
LILSMITSIWSFLCSHHKQLPESPFALFG